MASRPILPVVVVFFFLLWFGLYFAFEPSSVVNPLKQPVETVEEADGSALGLLVEIVEPLDRRVTLAWHRSSRVSAPAIPAALSRAARPSRPPAPRTPETASTSSPVERPSRDDPC